MLENLLGGDAAKALGGLVEQFESGNAAQVSPQDAAAHHDAVAQAPDDRAIPAGGDRGRRQARRPSSGRRPGLGSRRRRRPRADIDVLARRDPSSSASIGSLLTQLKDTPGGLSSLLTAQGAEKEASTLLSNAAVRTALVGVAATAAKKFL